MSRRDPAIAIEDMLEAIQTTEEYTRELSYQEYITDNRTKDAVVRNLEVLGEAAAHIPADFRERYSIISWKNVIGLRNVVIHHYFGIDCATIWFIVKEQLPVLKKQIDVVLQEFLLKNVGSELKDLVPGINPWSCPHNHNPLAFQCQTLFKES